jgi:RHO1 GDP-GTP exchange protein 1/2
VYVSKFGKLQRGPIGWETEANYVAFRGPYFLLFGLRVIEVRAISTGKLVQIISGSGIRCIHDGRGIGNNELLAVMDDVEGQATAYYIVDLKLRSVEQ